MEDYFRKSKRRPALAARAFPVGRGTLPPVPRARVPSPTPGSPRTAVATAAAGDTSASSAGASRPTRAPRKRFRKKVTGLFGDQTDLQKRMQKLLRHLPDDILSKRPTKAVISDRSPAYLKLRGGQRDSVPDQNGSLNLAKKVVDKMDAVNKAAQAVGTCQDSVQEGRRKLDNKEASISDEEHGDMNQKCEEPITASAEKWKPFQRRIGRLSPRSSDLFLDELDVGTSSPMSRPKTGLEPPSLPSLDDVPQTPVSTTDVPTNASLRAGTPAMLRRKVRRNERGYRGADVLRMRMSRIVDSGHDGTEALQKDDTVSPVAAGKAEDGLEVYVRSLNANNNKTRDVSVKRTRLEMAEQPKRIGTAKRRRVPDPNQNPVVSEVRHQDALALLIEAAEKEISADIVDDLPPRKTKRLRNSDWAPKPSINEHNDMRTAKTGLQVETLTEPQVSLRTAATSRRTRAARNVRIQARVPECLAAGAKNGQDSEDSGATLDE